MRKITEELSEFIYRSELGRIAPRVVETAKELVLDYCGVTIAGSSESSSTIVSQFVKDFAAQPEAGVVGQGFKTEASLAALVNGTSAHALDYDDYSLAVMAHVSAAVLPAVFALAEKHRSSGKALLESFLIGTEVVGRIGAVVALPHYQTGWHCTGTLGAIGAAAASAKLLGLDARQTGVALGIAASLAGGLRQNFGTLCKPLHAGRAAQNGVTAACLARRDFTAAADIFEGEYGFIRVLGGGRDFDLSKMILEPNSPFTLIPQGTILKPYPSCGATHCGILAGVQLHEQGNISPDDIAEIQLITHPMIPQVAFCHDPSNGSEARVSFEYCLSRAIVQGRVSLSDFTSQAVRDPGIKRLVRKIKYAYSNDKDYNTSATVVIKMKDGTQHSRRIEAPKGAPENPMTSEEVHQKFRDCASLSLSTENADRVLRLVLDLENLADITELSNLLCLTN